MLHSQVTCFSEVPFTKYFQINNSGFGLPDRKHNPTHEMFYDLGTKQFEIIFEELSKVQSKSIKLSLETLNERENITTWLFDIGQKVKLAMNCINESHKTYKYLQANKDKADANKDFKIPDTVVERQNEPVPNGKYTTYCVICVHTCHKNCSIPDDNQKMRCSAMRDGRCKICKNKCKWDEHKNHPYIIKYVTKTVYRTKKEMAEKYNMAKAESAKCEDIMKELMEDINDTEQDIIYDVREMRKSVNRLREIALNKKVLTDDEYFDTLIASEKEERKQGWEDRVKQLESMKKDNKLLKDVVDDEKNPLSWNKDKDFDAMRRKYGEPANKNKKKKKKKKGKRKGGWRLWNGASSVVPDTQYIGCIPYML